MEETYQDQQSKRYRSVCQCLQKTYVWLELNLFYSLMSRDCNIISTVCSCSDFTKGERSSMPRVLLISTALLLHGLLHKFQFNVGQFVVYLRKTHSTNLMKYICPFAGIQLLQAWFFFHPDLQHITFILRDENMSSSTLDVNGQETIVVTYNASLVFHGTSSEMSPLSIRYFY